MFRLQNNRFASSAWRMAAIDPPVRSGAECLKANAEFATNEVANEILEISRRKS